MGDAYVIEVEDCTAGIVVRDHGHDQFTFFASHPAVYALEGKRFAAPAAASRAAQKLLARQKTPTRTNFHNWREAAP